MSDVEQYAADVRDHAAMKASGKGPHIGGFCEDCGHIAMRHFGRECGFGQLREDKSPCECAGMLWNGERFEMDPRVGAIRVFELKELTE